MRRSKSLVAVVATSVVLVFSSTAVSAQDNVPTPESSLGFRVGDDFKLATYDESIAYFERLAASSDRIELRDVGRTSEGKRWVMALVSTPENLANVERYRDIARQLASPASLSDEQARQLAREGKAIVHIDGGLHASEVAHAQHTIQLAYDLVSSDDPAIEEMLENVIVMLWPSVNPDGQNIVVDWYRGNVGGPYEVSPVPWLYQKYVGHDNNRDAYMLDMIESRVLARTWRHWEPQIIYVHHQSSPFPTRIWLPPFAEPIASRVNPLMTRTVNAIGMLIAQGLEQRGQVGATHMGTGFDAWYPGYVDYMPMLRNIASWWTETALYAYATPKFYTLRDFPAGRRELRSESLYSSPWPGGWWHLRDAVDYMLTASVSTLDYAAKFKENLLYNRYQAGRDTIRKYAHEPPYAYFVPQQQRDPMAAVELLRRLAFNGVRVSQLDADVQYDGMQYPAGTWVIPMAQESAELARQVLEVQSYPDLREYPEGPPEQPYDAAGWTLPMSMGVRVIAGQAPLSEAIEAALRPLEGATADWSAASSGNVETDPAHDAAPFDIVPGVGFDTDAVAAGILPPPGQVRGSGPAVAIDPAHNNSYRAINRAWRAGGAVRFTAGADGAARYLLSGLDEDVVQALAADLALQVQRTRVAGRVLQKPRIGLYRPWTASMDEGWTRWLLERYEFDFDSLRNTELRAGDLRQRYDVIVLPSISGRSILEGRVAGSVPARYAGGVGSAGVRELDEFVRAGGTLLCFNASTLFAIEQLGLAVTNAVGELERDAFFSGISLLEGDVAREHPLMAGMPSKASLTTAFSPAFEVGEEFSGDVLIRYAAAGSPLLSGYLLGEEHLRDKAAAVRVPHGSGQVVLLGFAPQWRGQPFGTFRTIFNALLLPAESLDGDQ